MNEFVNYLNSTNNVGGNSTGSLAETQVKSIYFDMVKINRKLGEYISKSISDKKYQAFILTGHAGDGKTSILVQVLKSLQRLGIGKGLEEMKEYSDFFYVKDMSELPEDKQVFALDKALNSPSQGRSSLLISNTGPLLKTFNSLVESIWKSRNKDFRENDRITLQSMILRQLDSNENIELELEGFKFILVNIARVDNVAFSKQIFEKILNRSLWEECDVCSSCNCCPIKHNRDCVSGQFDRVSAFAENYYRFLYENDKRMTIRQMVSQISYALTGNLTCEEVKQKYLKEPFFNYNFANLFFGYLGLHEKRESSQIKGIEQIRLLRLDQIALNVDYQLFVTRDYSFFAPNIQEELKEIGKKYYKHYQITNEEVILSEKERNKEIQLRKAVRRFYLIYSLCKSDNDLEIILNQVFGINYSVYKKMITSKQDKLVLRNMQNIIFQALYMRNTGFLATAQDNYLPLTLRREDGVFQNVMMVLGEVDKNSIRVVQIPISNQFEDFMGKHEVYLNLNEASFKLSLPMVNYFNDLIDGAIASNSNPALSHGIATLDAILLEQYGDTKAESEEELTVLINTTEGQEIRRFAFDGKKLSIL